VWRELYFSHLLEDGNMGRKKQSKTVGGAGGPVVEGLAEVVELSKAKKRKKSELSRAEQQLATFYQKYSWVVSGSVREATDDDRSKLPHCHGKVCEVKCVDTGELRTINVQDAFQVKRTEEAQARYLRQRRAERKAAKKESKSQRAAS
jgi:hypothetical protein